MDPNCAANCGATCAGDTMDPKCANYKTLSRAGRLGLHVGRSSAHVGARRGARRGREGAVGDARRAGGGPRRRRPRSRPCTQWRGSWSSCRPCWSGSWPVARIGARCGARRGREGVVGDARRAGGGVLGGVALGPACPPPRGPPREPAVLICASRTVPKSAGFATTPAPPAEGAGCCRSWCPGGWWAARDREQEHEPARWIFLLNHPTETSFTSSRARVRGFGYVV